MTNRLDRAAAHEMIEGEASEVSGVLIMVNVGGEQVLLIRLGADGAIHRFGSGSLDRGQKDRFIGATTPEPFERVRARITPEFLRWCGRCGSHPRARGEACELVIALKRAEGEELMMAWQYGSHSQWPPPAVCDLVAARRRSNRALVSAGERTRAAAVPRRSVRVVAVLHPAERLSTAPQKFRAGLDAARSPKSQVVCPPSTPPGGLRGDPGSTTWDLGLRTPPRCARRH